MAKKIKKTSTIPPPSPDKKPAADSVKQQPANPEFEAQLRQTATEQQGGIKPDGRGGARPGAGRPSGASDELSRINKLPDVAHKGIAGAIELPFDLWATATKIKELALSDDEADDIALPITQLLAYYWPEAYDHIGWIWFCLVGSLTRVTGKRLKMIADMKQARKAPASVTAVAPAGPGQPSSSVPAGGGGFPQAPK